MISDILSEAVSEIREWLKENEIYGPKGHPLRDRIEACADEMDAIREVLDTPPDDLTENWPDEV